MRVKLWDLSQQQKTTTVTWERSKGFKHFFSHSLYAEGSFMLFPPLVWRINMNESLCWEELIHFGKCCDVATISRVCSIFEEEIKNESEIIAFLTLKTHCAHDNSEMETARWRDKNVNKTCESGNFFEQVKACKK